MGYNYNILHSQFFNELSQDKQQEFFNYTEKKFLPCIDNIYYSCFLENDSTDNVKVAPLLAELKEQKAIVSVKFEEVPFFQGLFLAPGGFNIYKYRLNNPDLYDIFILDYLPNEDTPRVLVQLRAYGLWVFGVDNMLIDSFNHVKSLFNDYFDDELYFNSISKCRENRIDYCYHTNIITNPHKAFSDTNIEKQLCTIFNTFGNRGHIEKNDDENNRCKLVKDYFSLGERKSNNIFVRIYNKGLEVVEMGYKSFFFEYWYKNGLINAYDKYCYEYAYEKDNYNMLHAARLKFYVENGTDEVIKSRFEKLLGSDSSTWVDFKVAADSCMPQVTTIINVEYETKRKFYYYSDDFIDSVLHTKEREDSPEQLRRIFKIVDNRGLFLDYLTSKTLSFKDPGKDDYVSWWKRLRSCKLDTIKSDDKLLRNYSRELDKIVVTKRAINAVGTAALYSGLSDFDFQADVSDLLSEINDNTMAADYYGMYKRIKNRNKNRLKNRL
jgi:hypothetical protein